MSNSWIDNITESNSPLHNKVLELLNSSEVVWEGLGIEGVDNLARNQQLDFEVLEDEYRGRIVSAFKEEDYLTMGKLFHFILSSYVLTVAAHQDPGLDFDDVKIEAP
jgi:hypothetical protein